MPPGQSARQATQEHPGIARFCKARKIDLTFVGPEGYLSEGIVNIFQEAGQRILGPKREAAVLENSKCTTKDLLKSLDVPVPPCQNFEDAAEAKEYVRASSAPRIPARAW